MVKSQSNPMHERKNIHMQTQSQSRGVSTLYSQWVFNVCMNWKFPAAPRRTVLTGWLESLLTAPFFPETWHVGLVIPSWWASPVRRRGRLACPVFLLVLGCAVPSAGGRCAAPRQGWVRRETFARPVSGRQPVMWLSCSSCSPSTPKLTSQVSLGWLAHVAPLPSLLHLPGEASQQQSVARMYRPVKPWIAVANPGPRIPPNAGQGNSKHGFQPLSSGNQDLECLRSFMSLRV